MSDCKIGGKCGQGGFCDDCYQLTIDKQRRKIEALESLIDVIEVEVRGFYTATNTIAKSRDDNRRVKNGILARIHQARVKVLDES